MERLSFEHGIAIHKAENWKEFLIFINDTLEFNHFIWRGQADSAWLLEPTLDRFLKETGKIGIEAPQLTSLHLEKFKYATRGRRGVNPIEMKNENDWWALGQHHGLYTPLLDWTNSPFVAAYFALISRQTSSTNFRSIFGISQITVEGISKQLSNKAPGASIIEFINLLTDENNRLVNQRGLFTKSAIGLDIESWYKQNLPQVDDRVRMWKILIPEKERIIALQSLNRMNINHSTLFPDLYGASKFTNLNLEIEKY